MRLFKTSSLVSPMAVTDYEAALKWYASWLGTPDEVPMDGMAEWLIAPNAWLQLDSHQPENAGQGAAIIGVEDIAAARAALQQAGIAAGDIADYGVVQVCDVRDPDGNRLSLVQVLE